MEHLVVGRVMEPKSVLAGIFGDVCSFLGFKAALQSRSLFWGLDSKGSLTAETQVLIQHQAEGEAEGGCTQRMATACLRVFF